MTTLAYRAGVLAADSRCKLSGWNASYPLQKLHRLKDGSVAGMCGNYAEGLAFISWLNSDRSAARPTLANSTVVHMQASGLTVHEAEGSFPIEAEFGAWGSGMPPALGALHMGATAEKAVEIAAVIDDSTGGAIVSMKAKQ